MKPVTLSIFLLMFLGTSLSVFAQDYGTHIPVNLDDSVKKSIWHTDWSPDGKWITFEVDDDIYVYNLEDREIKNVTVTIEESCMFPCFTPDSQEVTFTLLNYARNFQSPSWDHIEGINLYTGERRLVMDAAFEGSYSHDGNYFIYNYWPRDEPDFSYAIYDNDRDETTYYNFGPEPPIFSPYPVCMSPDNTHFVATLDNSDHRSIENALSICKLYSIDLDDGESVQIDLGYGDFWYPEFSPNGTWLIYTQMTDNFKYFNVCIYNIETGKIIYLIPDSEFNTHTASWSPDGTQLCYILDTDTGHELYIKDFEFASEPTRVSHAEETPIILILHGNYPNPFNPSTTIKFSIPQTGFTDLVIYNVMGQKVRELVSGTFTEGLHSVVWNGKDDNGQAVSAGVYVIRLRMGDAKTTGRVMLVK
ncbi:MAG: PD40 domain-containing protein [Candidatus Latescibacteria bacterium]|nr:PD40 domain-containing protein [Candidatus Latescibacterota bacterium]